MLGVTADQLLEIARERTGLSDFGDERFLTPFRRMIASVNAATRFSDAGRELAKERFLRSLVNRLRFRADLTTHPEILDEVILPPIVILGLPRTGSTKLHRMLWQGGDFRGMLMWQGYNPAPFPDAPRQGPDPRIEAAAQFLAWRASRHQSISAAHHAEALEPEEEIYLLEPAFSTWAPGGYFEMPDYLDWVRGADRDQAYLLLRQMLQYLQWQHHRGAAPKPWILKTPMHFGHEAEIMTHFPGAHIVLMHRDLQEAVPSLISLSAAMRHQYCADPPSLPEVAAWILAECSDTIDRHMAWRDRAGDRAALDVAYTDVVEADMEVAARVYDFSGLRLGETARAAMAEWSVKNAQHSQGRHVYSLEGTGLTAEDIDRRFEAYRRRFAAYLPPSSSS